jgi:hypothetical protein
VGSLAVYGEEDVTGGALKILIKDRITREGVRRLSTKYDGSCCVVVLEIRDRSRACVSIPAGWDCIYWTEWVVTTISANLFPSGYPICPVKGDRRFDAHDLEAEYR